MLRQIDLFQLLRCDAIADHHVIQVHQRITHFFYEVTADFLVLHDALIPFFLDDIRHLSGFQNLGAELPFVGAVALVIISVLLTLVAGAIPATIAAKREPVEALRSE